MSEQWDEASSEQELNDHLGSRRDEGMKERVKEGRRMNCMDRRREKKGGRTGGGNENDDGWRQAESWIAIAGALSVLNVGG